MYTLTREYFNKGCSPPGGPPHLKLCNQSNQWNDGYESGEWWVRDTCWGRDIGNEGDVSCVFDCSVILVIMGTRANDGNLQSSKNLIRQSGSYWDVRCGEWRGHEIGSLLWRYIRSSRKKANKYVDLFGEMFPVPGGSAFIRRWGYASFLGICYQMNQSINLLNQCFSRNTFPPWPMRKTSPARTTHLSNWSLPYLGSHSSLLNWSIE